MRQCEERVTMYDQKKFFFFFFLNGNLVEYHGVKMSEPLDWARIERELGEPVYDVRRLTPPKVSRATWAVRTLGAGELIVKVRHGDRADEKTRWCADRLPLLGARGYPVPEFVWHGPL